MHRRWLVAAVVLAGGCSWSDAPAATHVEACARDGTIPDGLVTRDADGAFVASGVRFVPRGVGSYPLLEHAGNGRMAEVDEILAEAVRIGRPLVRTNAFLDGGTNPARIREDDGTLREEGLVGLDRLLAAASAHGVRLILVLTNNWHDYGGAGAVLRAVAPGEELPHDAFWSDPRAIDAQRAYIAAIVGRTSTIDGRAYADDPTVLAWELVNEARCDDPELCDDGTLARWARAMAGAVRSAGARQLVAWGGAGHDGEHGEDLERIARDGDVDVLTLHLYPFASHALRLDDRSPLERLAIGVRVATDAVRDRAAIARRHRLPLLVEEVGWRGIGGDDRDGERGVFLGAVLRAAREEGVGAMPWMIAERGRPDYDGLLIDTDRDLATMEAVRCE